MKKIIKIFMEKRKEKKLISLETVISKQSKEDIYLVDFDNKIYISYHGTPIMLVEGTSEEILQKLNEVRKNFINFTRLKLI